MKGRSTTVSIAVSKTVDMGSIPVAPATPEDEVPKMDTPSVKTGHAGRARVSRKTRYVISGIFCFLTVCAIGVFISTVILEQNITIKPDWVPDSFCKTNDKEAPEITINGEEVKSLKVGDGYEELGARAVDDCDEVEVGISGEVDTNKVGIYNIIYSAVDLSGNKAEVRRTVSVVPEYHGTIYLTFDDGPGPYTSELLDVLAMYGVKATFFVTGRGDDELIAREYNEGHAIGLHTFSHDYAYIYSGVDEFFDDLYRVQERVRNITGENSFLMRFPGGSSNTVSMRYDGNTHIMSQLVGEVGARGFTYFDWNISSGDAGGVLNTDDVRDNVIERLVEYGDSVVLQHDIKDFSVAAVEGIIQYGLMNGYEFKKLDAGSFKAHHGVNN